MGNGEDACAESEPHRGQRRRPSRSRPRISSNSSRTCRPPPPVERWSDPSSIWPSHARSASSKPCNYASRKSAASPRREPRAGWGCRSAARRSAVWLWFVTKGSAHSQLYFKFLIDLPPMLLFMSPTWQRPWRGPKIQEATSELSDVILYFSKLQCSNLGASLKKMFCRIEIHNYKILFEANIYINKSKTHLAVV